MKQVSFKVAKALKEAGYPQCKSDYHWFPIIDFKTKDIKEWVYHKAQILWSPTVYEKKTVIDAPTYFDVWLWLWAEKKECIDIISAHNHDALVHINGELKGFNDPEEAIANAIDYLVDNNLIK